jgi:EpsI family protein
MNIVRIAVTGILVEYFGSAAAEGFFHEFEGWIIYCGCLALLMLEMKALCYVGRGDRSVLHRLDLDLPRRRATTPDGIAHKPITHMAPILAVAGLCVVCLIAILAIGSRDENLPARLTFGTFPRQIGQWKGIEQPVDQEALVALATTDHLSVNYVIGNDKVVNLWSAYYRSQFSGSAAHSPLVCIPGGGWAIESTGVRDIPLAPGSNTASMTVNRLIIAQGSERQLVYYWFVEGGRIETNDYLAKARLFTNSIFYNRRDGALVRFIVPIENGDVDAAEHVLQQFVAQAAPKLSRYLP